MPAQPKNKQLYSRVVAEAKRRFNVWPSAYASGWVVQEYKRRGGTYTTGGASASRTRKRASPLGRWYAEKWIDVCQLPKKVACGRPKGSRSPYPYCRPLRRISKKTPRTVSELSRSELRHRCSVKRSNPRRRVLSKRRSKM